MSTSLEVMREQQGQPRWASEDAVVLAGVDFRNIGFFGSDNSPAAVAEREMALKSHDRAAVSEPAAFDRYAGGRREHWCAHFVSWLHAAAGKPLPDWKPPSPDYFPRHAGCNWLWDHLSKYGMTHNGMPRRNDIIFYKHPDPQYKSGHVGLVTAVKDGRVYSIEGNLSSTGKSDTVALLNRPLDSSKIYGYGRAYSPDVLSGPTGSLVKGVGVFAATFLIAKAIRKRRA